LANKWELIIDWQKNLIGCLHESIFINLYYPGYREEQPVTQNTPYYEIHWEERRIYN